MVDEERFLTRLAGIEQDLAALEKYRGMTVERLASDLDARWAAERGLHVVIDGLLEIGAHVLSSDFGIQTFAYRETAERMVEKGIVKAAGFPRIASFRNVLVHEYVKMDLGILAGILADGVGDLSACAGDLRQRSWQKNGTGF